MTKRTITRLTMTLERIEITSPSSAPFRAAPRVIDTTGYEIHDSELPPSQPRSNTRSARVIPLFRKVG